MKPRKETFPTSLLTEGDRETGWFKCEDVACRPTKLAPGVPHLHREVLDLRLGDGAASAANLDYHDEVLGECVQSRRVRGGVIMTGTRSNLLEVLYLLEAAPAYFAGGGANGADCQAWEVSAIRRTVKAWRKALGLADGDKVPTPEWARTVPS